MALIIDGKKIAAELRAECIARTNRLLEKGIKPRLDVIIVGVIKSLSISSVTFRLKNDMIPKK